MRISPPAILWFIIITFVYGCNTEDSITVKQLSVLPANQAIEKIERVKSDYWVYLCQESITERSILQNQKNEARLFFQYLEKRGTLEKNTYALNTFHRAKVLELVNSGKYDSALYHARTAATYINTHDSIVIGHTLHSLGLAFHYLNLSDSVIKYWQRGYEEAELEKNHKMILLFAGNLGTVYYNQGNSRTARMLFKRAAESSVILGQKNPIIINNIISTMLDDGQYEIAFKYWDEHKTLLKFDVNTYQGQLFILNRINLLSNVNLIDESDSILNTITKSNIFPTLKTEFLRVLVQSKFRKKDFSIFTDTNYQKDIKHIIARISQSNRQELIANVNQPQLQGYYSDLIDFANSEKISNASLKQQSAIHHILGAYYKTRNKEKSIYHLNSGLFLATQAEKEQVSLNNKVIDELNQFEQISSKIRDTELKMREENRLNQILWITVATLAIFLILIYFILNKNLKIKNIEQKQLVTEQDALKKEQELNKRIVEYSKIIIERNQTLRSQLQTIATNASKDVQQKIREIIKSLNDTSINEKENPVIANQIIQNEKEELEQLYPGFKELNTTEQRVLVLTHQNYRPKDIATVLGVSTQYVRNIKSRLKSKIDISSET